MSNILDLTIKRELKTLVNKRVGGSFYIQLEKPEDMQLSFFFTIKTEENGDIIYEAKENTGVVKNISDKRVHITIPSNLNFVKASYFNQLKIVDNEGQIVGLAQGVLTVQ